MEKLWYGLVRKKSNHTPAEIPATSAANLQPGRTTTATTTTMARARSVFGT